MSKEDLSKARELRYIARIAKLECDKAEAELNHFIQLCLVRQGVNREVSINLDTGVIS